MADPIKFYLDQNVTGGTAGGLRAVGIDVISAQEASRCGLSDPDQLSFATAEGRVLVTFDQDYLAIDATGIPHCGIVYCHPTKYPLGALIHELAIVHGAMTADELRDTVHYL